MQKVNFFENKGMKILKIIGVLFLLMSITSIQVFAHPGNTDSLGGHTCYTNFEEWGLYY